MWEKIFEELGYRLHFIPGLCGMRISLVLPCLRHAKGADTNAYSCEIQRDIRIRTLLSHWHRA
jgi:hypothetical protein